MIFVNKVRELHYGRTDEDLVIDIQMAIDYCIEHDILKEFLISRRNEVTKNMQLDYTFDRQLELEREDAREEGRKEGRKEGREEGQKEGKQLGREQGLEMANRLVTLLLSDGRTEDLRRSASDKEYQMQLLKEYDLM